VHVYAARGHRLGLLRLRYRVSDDKAQTSERISVFRRTRLLRRFARPLRQTDSAVAYWVLWRAPRSRARYRFCVRATDAAGNRSPLACAPIAVR
jgi:hypothetical protein